jgi:hypothetical protein
MKNTKFIIVQDADTANKLKLSGFQMVSETNGIYTFMNTIPQHFNFEEIDIKKLVYTDRLVF